jgi:serine phosphatase RsbU (regulator of sigma subunit)
MGDVAGKELHAGVLIAFIVGAIRTAAQFYPDPLAVLVTLNERLCNLKNAQATCMALRIARDGGVTLVDAGHPPPYLNGEEVAIEGALPLGITPDAEFPISYFQLAHGDTLILVSDGVAKAHGKRGGLFGFERIQELLKRRSSAEELATAAQEFGQCDDISVLSVTRRAARKTAP